MGEGLRWSERLRKLIAVENRSGRAVSEASLDLASLRASEILCSGSCLALLQNVQSRSFPGASPLPISSTGAPAASKPFCSGSGGAFMPDMHGRQLNLRRGRRSGPVGWRPGLAIGQVPVLSNFP